MGPDVGIIMLENMPCGGFTSVVLESPGAILCSEDKLEPGGAGEGAPALEPDPLAEAAVIIVGA